jgi:HD-like signal output (HDOD) protein
MSADPMPIYALDPLITAREIVRRSDALSPSGALLRINEEIRRGGTNALRLARLIESSPQLAARVLRLANSGFYAPLQSVSSLSRGVAVLGDVVLRQLVLASIADARRPAGRSLRQTVVSARLMGDAVRSAVVCRELARMRRRDSDTAFAAGLLHDLGRVYLMEASGDTYAVFLERRAMDPEVSEERDLFGVSHEDIGVILASDWDVPVTIADALRAHHAPVAGSMAELARASDVLVARLSKPVRDATEADEHAEAALATLGLTPAQWTVRLPAVREQIAELMRLFG